MLTWFLPHRQVDGEDSFATSPVASLAIVLPITQDARKRFPWFPKPIPPPPWATTRIQTHGRPIANHLYPWVTHVGLPMDPRCMKISIVKDLGLYVSGCLDFQFTLTPPWVNRGRLVGPRESLGYTGYDATRGRPMGQQYILWVTQRETCGPHGRSMAITANPWAAHGQPMGIHGVLPPTHGCTWAVTAIPWATRRRPMGLPMVYTAGPRVSHGSPRHAHELILFVGY